MSSSDDQKRADRIAGWLMDEVSQDLAEKLAQHWVGVPVESTQELREVLELYVHSKSTSPADRALLHRALWEIAHG